MKRNAVVSLLFSIALLCGGGLLSQPAAAGESDVEIMPSVSEYPTETGAESLDRAVADEEGEEAAASQRLPVDSTDIERSKKTGTVYVVNKSSYGAYVYLDKVLTSENCLLSGYTRQISKVKRGQHELVAVDCADPDYGWGPQGFKLKKKYTWTLYN